MEPDKTNVLAVQAVRAASPREAKDSLSSSEESSERPRPRERGKIPRMRERRGGHLLLLS